MFNENIPGTNISYSNANDAFTVFRPMLEMTGGLSLGQVCKLTDLQPSTIQNWVKRGYVQRPESKKYYERHLARILLISSLRDCMNIEEIGELMVLINGDTEDENDDIVSEATLYDFFCRAVRKMDELSLNDESIGAIISEILKDESDELIRERLTHALKVMVYAYVSGKCLKQIKANLKELRNA